MIPPTSPTFSFSCRDEMHAHCNVECDCSCHLYAPRRFSGVIGTVTLLLTLFALVYVVCYIVAVIAST